jgi:hypothetical protein
VFDDRDDRGVILALPLAGQRTSDRSSLPARTVASLTILRKERSTAAATRLHGRRASVRARDERDESHQQYTDAQIKDAHSAQRSFSPLS